MHKSGSIEKLGNKQTGKQINRQKDGQTETNRVKSLTITQTTIL